MTRLTIHVVAALGLLASGLSELSAQVRLGRQAGLSPAQIQSLQAAIADRGGRVIIGFKPATAARGLGPDGSPVLSTQQVASMVTALQPLAGRTIRQFSLIPAVSAAITPDQILVLLSNPVIDYVQPSVLYEPTDLAPVARRVQTTPWGISRVDAPSAWSITRGVGARLGIIDTGIDSDHPDLNVTGGINLVTGGTSPADWDDASPSCFSHGTHVAGSAAALDNADGVVGVAPDVALHALRVFDPESAGFPDCFASDADIVAALDYAAGIGLDVVNLSLGSTETSFALGDAVTAANAAGVVIVAAAGNEGSSNIIFPAAYADAVAVAAIDITDAQATFSSFGPEVELAAPGVDVLSTTNDGGTGLLSGTSMASPHVAGTVALLRALDPTLAPEEVRQILRSTADDILTLGVDLESGHGVVQAGGAVTTLSGSPTAAVDPGQLALAADPGGSLVTEPVELSNIGAPGTITWTATTDQLWLSASPGSGSATDGAPSTIDMTADPTGLAAGIYTGFVTFTHDAPNTPVTLRVQLAVADFVTVDAAAATFGSIALGERLRYQLNGRAGDEIDIALLTDFNAPLPLDDPVLRLYGPDGVTLLATNDDAPYAGISFQSLLFRQKLPETGTYFVEVGGFADNDEGAFILKARPTDAILGIDPAADRSLRLRTEENGAVAATTVEIVNLTGVGSLSFTIVTSELWLTANPSEGTASPPPPLTQMMVTPSSAKPAGARPADPKQIAAQLMQRYPEAAFRRRSAIEFQPYPEVAPNPSGPPTASATVAATAPVTVTFSADPTGLALGTSTAVAFLLDGDLWLGDIVFNFLIVGFRVFTAGMEVASEGHVSPIGLTSRSAAQAIGVADDNADGSLFPIASTGSSGPAIASGFVANPAGVTAGLDGNWYVGVNNIFDTELRRVFPDGSFDTFATLPTTPFFVTTGPSGEFYTSLPLSGQIYSISADGLTVAPFGPAVTFPFGIAYNPTVNALYVADAVGGIRVIGLDGLDQGTVATNVLFPDGIAVGSSGLVYIGNFFGEVWVYDPSGVATDATLLGVAPAEDDLFGLTLVEGALLMSALSQGEIYRFPVADGPAGSLPADIVVRVETQNVSVALGEAFSLPVTIDLVNSLDGVHTYTVGLRWDPGNLTVSTTVSSGDFSTPNGVFVANTDQTIDGEFQAAAAEPAAVGPGGTLTLFTVDVAPDLALGPGAQIPIELLLAELGGPSDKDLLGQVQLQSGLLCTDVDVFGDIDGSGAVAAVDATQVLRSLVGLSVTGNVGLADANGDGQVGIADAVQILRFIVGLPIPASSRINVLRVFGGVGCS